ncbi:hypothetical protein TNCV_2559371 [Trichonephila clavipes]|nr:hypothetical protein TNCV_2559371 [Trichonephila clavipes]
MKNQVVLYARKPVHFIPLQPRHLRERLCWCKVHVGWDHQNWSRVTFSNKSRFSVTSNSGHLLPWRERRTYTQSFFVNVMSTAHAGWCREASFTMIDHRFISFSEEALHRNGIGEILFWIMFVYLEVMDAIARNSLGMRFLKGRSGASPFCVNLFSICKMGSLSSKRDHQARRRFVEWAQNEIAVVPDFHKRILFSDEAHFWLNGYVNKQNCRIWSEANPQVYVETPLHPEKLTVWCALWAGGILLQK